MVNSLRMVNNGKQYLSRFSSSDYHRVSTKIDHHHHIHPLSKSRSTDMRSVKSLNLDKESNGSSNTLDPQLYRKQREVDYTSEPGAPIPITTRPRNSMRPTPPKKPLRLSLQRAQSLQTIEANATAAILELDKKRAIKRTHRGGNKTPDLQQYIENSFNGGGSQPQLQTASLGRNKHL